MGIATIKALIQYHGILYVLYATDILCRQGVCAVCYFVGLNSELEVLTSNY